MMHGSAFHGASRGFTDEKTFGRVYDRRVILRLLPYVIPYKRLAALATFAMLIYTASQVSIPFMIKLGIDSFIEEDDFNGLTIVFGAFISVALINWVANYTQQLSMEKVGQGVLYDLRRTMFSHLQKLSLSYYDKTEVGRIMSRVQGDVWQLQEFMAVVIMTLADLLSLLGIIIALLTPTSVRYSSTTTTATRRQTIHFRSMRTSSRCSADMSSLLMA